MKEEPHRMGALEQGYDLQQKKKERRKENIPTSNTSLRGGEPTSSQRLARNGFAL